MNVANVDGRTALDSARAQKMPAVVTLLESHGSIGTGNRNSRCG